MPERLCAKPAAASSVTPSRSATGVQGGSARLRYSSRTSRSSEAPRRNRLPPCKRVDALHRQGMRGWGTGLTPTAARLGRLASELPRLSKMEVDPRRRVGLVTRGVIREQSECQAADQGWNTSHAGSGTGSDLSSISPGRPAPCPSSPESRRSASSPAQLKNLKLPVDNNILYYIILTMRLLGATMAR
jgi:hypothetical protein